MTIIIYACAHKLPSGLFAPVLSIDRELFAFVSPDGKEDHSIFVTEIAAQQFADRALVSLKTEIERFVWNELAFIRSPVDPASGERVSEG